MTTAANGTYRASGPGPKTRDGCSVDLYCRLPYRGEAEILKPLIQVGASVLELGCGVGRVTRELLAQGYRVTAVDNSGDMLAHVPVEAIRVCEDIEKLDLGKPFDAALLGSCLINIPDEDLRTEQLRKVGDHLRERGILIFERHDPAWLSDVGVGPVASIGPIEVSVLEACHRGDEVDLCISYSHDGATWLQYFSAQVLDDGAVATVLANAGFGPPTWIDRRWAMTATIERRRLKTT